MNVIILVVCVRVSEEYSQFLTMTNTALISQAPFRAIFQ